MDVMCGPAFLLRRPSRLLVERSGGKRRGALVREAPAGNARARGQAVLRFLAISLPEVQEGGKEEDGGAGLRMLLQQAAERAVAQRGSERLSAASDRPSGRWAP